MSIDKLKDYIKKGNEIEFKYLNKMYSITYGYDNGHEIISFCEFYKETTEVTSFEELLKVSRYGISVLDMWKTLSENDVWIY